MEMMLSRLSGRRHGVYASECWDIVVAHGSYCVRIVGEASGGYVQVGIHGI